MKTMPESLKISLNEALISCQCLFPVPETAPEFFRVLKNLLEQMSVSADIAAALEKFYDLIPHGVSFCQYCDQELLAVLKTKMPSAGTAEMTKKPAEADEAFFCAHAKQLVRHLTSLIPEYLALFPADGLPRIRPSAKNMTTEHSLFLRLADSALALEIRKKSLQVSPFGKERVYRHRNGSFQPVRLDSIRKIDEFYGYAGAKRVFLEHFGAFAAGKANLPLLISSLPGLGKTQMTIAHTLHFPELTLILPEPSDISTGLEDLLRTLADENARKFVIFFDDIDAGTTDWYYFRSHVGGTFSLPENVSIAIESNQRFPANISSRGRGFEFPIFDEVRCQEMIADYLSACGLRDPPPDLVSVIASDYVEAFGQKMFEELSPRTLIRYLRIYESDDAKRKQLLENSRAELITQPDAQVFYDENVKRMRSIYGDAILDELREDSFHG